MKEQREQINRIDEEILKLYAERMKISEEIGRIKAEKGLPVYDAAREDEILKRARDAGAEELYKVILAESKKMQSRLFK